MGDGISVETDQLDDFGSKVDKGATNYYDTGYRDTTRKLASTPDFGQKNASEVVQGVRQQLTDAGHKTAANVQNYCDAAAILAKAAKDFAAELRRTDGRSANSLKQIQYLQNAMVAAQQALNQEHLTQDKKDADQQLQREVGRAQ